MRVSAFLKTLLLAIAAAAASVIGALSAGNGRTYDTAVVCKAFSLLAVNSSDDKSMAAVQVIDAEIASDSAQSGRSAEQARVDVEFSRQDWANSKSEQSFFDNEWGKCLSIWSP